MAKSLAVSAGHSHGKSMAVTRLYLVVKYTLLPEEIWQIKFRLPTLSYLRLYSARKLYIIVLGPFSRGNIF
jgi:hypothetical protein